MHGQQNIKISRPVALKGCGVGTWAVYIFVFLAYVLEINSETRNIHLLFFLIQEAQPYTIFWVMSLT